MEYTAKEQFFDLITFGPALAAPAKLSSSAAVQKVGEGLQTVEDDQVADAQRAEHAQDEIIGQAENLLAQPELTPEIEAGVIGLAQEFQRPAPSETAKLVAETNRLARQADDMLVGWEEVRKARRQSAEALQGQLTEAIDEVDWGVLRTAGSVAQLLIDPTDGVRYVNLAREAFPEAEIPVGAAGGDAMGRAAQWLLRQDPQVAAERLKEFIKQAETLGAVVDSPIDRWDALSIMREALEDGTAYGNRVTVDDIFGWANILLPAAGVAGRAVKRVFNGVGHTAGSGPALAARTTQGQRQLLDAAGSEAGDSALAAAGTDAGRVVGAAALPRPPVGTQVHLSNDSIPFESVYLTAEERLAAQSDFRALKGKRVELHTNKSTVKPVEGGFEYEQVYGPSTGGVFKTKKEAAAFMADIDPSLKPEFVRDELSGGWLAKVNGTRYYQANDKAKFGQMTSTGLYQMYLGKGLWMDKETRGLTTWAATRSAAMERQMNTWTEPYFKLAPEQKLKLNKVLVDYTDRKWLTNAELAEEGIDEAGQAAYRGLRQAADKAWEIQNAEMASAAIEAGRKFVKVGNQRMIGDVVDTLPPNVREVLHAGDNVAIQVRPDMDGRFVKLPSPQRHGNTSAMHQYVFVPNKGKGSKAVSDIRLGDAVLNYRPGYYGTRRYTAPYLIRKPITVLVDGVEETREIVVRTARSERSAKAWIEAQEDSQLYRADIDRGARGTAGSDVLDDDMAWTGRRRDDYIPDVDLEMPGARGGDAARIGSIENAIRGMQHVAALNYGLGKANRLLMAQWTKTYGKVYGEFSPNQKIILKAEGREMSAEADAMHDYIMRNMGLDQESTNARIAKFRTDLADFFWNQHLAPFDWLGDVISGRSDSVRRFLKSSTYITYLALNPTRQLIMQMTMIPTYLGVRGAGAYAGSGQLFRDYGALLGSHLSRDEVAHFVRVSNGEKKLAAESAAALEDWNNSGLSRLVDANILTIDTIVDSSKHATGRLSMMASQGLDLIKRAGIDAGIQADKRFAFLIARNRYLTDKGLPRTHKLNKDELREVAGLTEDLSLNQNRSDVLAVQRGTVGLITQFMSHQLKMTGRVMDQAQAFLPRQRPSWVPDGVPWFPVDRGGESGFSRAERRRMAGMALLSYGTAGYGVTNVVGGIEAQLGVQVPAPVKTTVEQGLNGLLVDNFFRLADWDGDPTELAFSETFSPTGFVGNTVEGTGALLSAMASLSPSAMWDSGMAVWEALEPASFNLAESVREIVKLGAVMSFNGHLFAGDRSEQIGVLAEKGLRTFPLINQVAQGIAIMETGFSQARGGQSIVEASVGEGLARAILGIRDRASPEIQSLQADLYDQTIGLDTPGRLRAVAQAAQDDWKMYVQPFFKPGSNPKEMYEALDTLFASRQKVFGVYAVGYQEVMQRYILSVLDDRSSRDKMVESWLSGAFRGDIPVGQNVVDSIKSGPDWQGKQEFIDTLQQLVEQVGPTDLDKSVSRR